MNYRYCCVIDAENRYKTFVLVEDGAVLHYTLQAGETLVDTKPPKMRIHAGTNGFISPVWNEEAQAWVESATAGEITVWEAENPAPEVVDIPSQLDRTEAQAIYTAMMTDTLLEDF